MSLIAEIQGLAQKTLQEVSAAPDLAALEEIRVRVLGKKGALSEILKKLGSLSAEERPAVGAGANLAKREIEDALELRKNRFESEVLEKRLASEQVDWTMPARKPFRGNLHIVTQTTQKILDVLGRLGFETVTGPEIETEYLNFEAVNIPKDHPARDMQDTFFVGPGTVLRTHTSAVQMRVMREQKAPIRVLCPGAVYRCDHDATHSPMFHQIEGLWVDRGVKMSDLKGTLEFFARELFGAETRIRLRPSFFPFVEPGAEVDVSCFACKSKPQASCRICKGTGWLEILGAGMVHPRLFEMAGIREPGLTGFAFGLGVERIAMLLHKVPDLRLMFSGDSRFLSQF